MSIQEAIRYGAVELKRVYSRNLALALVVSVAVHLSAIGLYLLTVEEGTARPEVNRDRDTVYLGVFEPLEPPIELPELPPAGGSGDVQPPVDANPEVTKYKAGDVRAVPDNLVPDDAPDYAPITDISNSGPIGGGEGELGPKNDKPIGLGPSDSASQGPSLTLPVETPKEPWEIPEESLPKFDLGKLRQRVVYPKVARDNNLEGKVEVRVLIGKFGDIERVEVTSSDYSVFEAPAIKAIRETTFTPARLDNTPVSVWMTIPITFELD
jgi:TonB family protein